MAVLSGPLRVRVSALRVACLRLISTSCGVASVRLALTRWPSPKRRSIARTLSSRVLFVGLERHPSPQSSNRTVSRNRSVQNCH